MVLELTFICLANMCLVPSQQGQLFTREQDCQTVAAFLFNDEIKGECVDAAYARTYTSEITCPTPNGPAMGVRHLSGVVDCDNNHP